MLKICTSFAVTTLLVMGYLKLPKSVDLPIVESVERNTFKSKPVKILIESQHSPTDLTIDDSKLWNPPADVVECKNYVLKGDRKVCLIEAQDEYSLYEDADAGFVDDEFVEDDFDSEQILPLDVDLMLDEVAVVTKDVEVFEYVSEE